MDDAVDTVYQPGAKFVEEKKDSVIDLELTDSTELLLFQWPINQAPDFDGKQLSITLKDGHMGVLESSCGKSYDMFSMKSQSHQETVFLPSALEPKTAGKISRLISLIHYPDPSELQNRNSLFPCHSQRSSLTSSLSGHRMDTPTRSSRPRSQAMSGYTTPSSRTKSTVTGSGERSKRPKRKRDDEGGSGDHSAQDSGKTNSDVTSTGSMEQSQERKSKKKRKSES